MITDIEVLMWDKRGRGPQRNTGDLVFGNLSIKYRKNELEEDMHGSSV